MRLIYIAGPYRSTNPDGKSNAWGVQQNVMRAMARALEVWRRGHAAVCPHANTMFFQDADGCADSVWLEGDVEILRRCDAVMTVDGWQQSKGATAEVLIATKGGKPIIDSVNSLEIYLAHQDNIERVHRMFMNACAARIRNVMTGETVETGIDEGGSTGRFWINGAVYQLEWQEDVILRRANDERAIPGSIEIAADPFCSCSAPDLVGHEERPETYRCLTCGYHPDPSTSVHVRLLPSSKVTSKLTVPNDRVATLWSKAVRNAAGASMSDVQTFAQLLIEEIRPSVLDMITHAREDGWKAALEAKS